MSRQPLCAAGFFVEASLHIYLPVVCADLEEFRNEKPRHVHLSGVETLHEFARIGREAPACQPPLREMMRPLIFQVHDAAEALHDQESKRTNIVNTTQLNSWTSRCRKRNSARAKGTSVCARTRVRADG